MRVAHAAVLRLYCFVQRDRRRPHDAFEAGMEGRGGPVREQGLPGGDTRESARSIVYSHPHSARMAAELGCRCLVAQAPCPRHRLVRSREVEGCSLALAADFTIAGRSAYFLQALVNIGLVPDGGSTWLLARAVGRARATRMMMLGEKIGAAQAEEWGLIYKCVDDAELMAEARALAEGLQRMLHQTAWAH